LFHKQFRDQLIAAPLKRTKNSASLTFNHQFRDQLIAAPLKLGIAGSRPSRCSEFRDQLIAAPLKHTVFADEADVTSIIPRSADRGPIEAGLLWDNYLKIT